MIQLPVPAIDWANKGKGMLHMLTITWLIRYAHVLDGGLWVGGYALLALVIIPHLEKVANNVLAQAAMAVVRLLTYSGMGIIFLTSS